jgi:hypothetical protein
MDLYDDARYGLRPTDRAIRNSPPAGAAPDDVVNAPSHYQSGTGLEAINVIEAFELGFRLGNAVKYILRAGKKGNRLEDLKKARWYLDREISSSPASRGDALSIIHGAGAIAE